MAITNASLLAAMFFLALSVLWPAAADASPVPAGGAKVSNNFLLAGRNLAPLAEGLLKFSPLASGPVAMAPNAGFPLVLAEKRTRRPDMLNNFKLYRGGWDITNKHYWSDWLHTSIYWRGVLIMVAAIMLLLSVVGFALSILGQKDAIYVTVGDTCTAMDEWVHYPQAETALSNILPCVDQQTTNRTLYQSKEVILQLVSVVNSVIRSIANLNSESQGSYFFNQSGPLMPLLCSPYDTNLQLRECRPYEVSFSNASVVWENYICAVSNSCSCAGVGRVTPTMYMQLVTAVNASYALDYYAPLLLSLQDCKFVRESFNIITTHYCPYLERDLRMVSAGLVLISIGVMLSLILWILYANRPQREEVFVTPSEVKASSDKIPVSRG